jgi:uncharacterized metal-binding protein
MSDCSCDGVKPKLIFACSGGADVGAMADQAARQLAREGAGRMFCLAGIGGRVSGIMQTTAAAETLLAINGCPVACASAVLRQAGFNEFQEIQLAELGCDKGHTPPSLQVLERIVERGRDLLGTGTKQD